MYEQGGILSAQAQGGKAHKGRRDRGGRIRMVWPQNPTLPRLRRPAVPEQPCRIESEKLAVREEISRGRP